MTGRSSPADDAARRVAAVFDLDYAAGIPRADTNLYVFDPDGKFIRAFGSQFQGGGHGLEVRKEADGEFLYVTGYQMLKTFAERPNRVLSREQLLDLAHDRASDPYDRSIDIRIARLRRKIERDPADPKLIRTVRGAGYKFTPDKA